jgi:uncharacterized protein with HEPN domain
MRRTSVFLFDIVNSIDQIDHYINKVDFDTFCATQLLIDGVIRNLEIIGEASRYIPEDFRKKYPEIDWKKMTGMRNILIHQYFGVDEWIVWETAKTDLPKIKPLLIKAIHDCKESGK